MLLMEKHFYFKGDLESFAEFNPDNIRDTFKLILQMHCFNLLSFTRVKVGRIAGQFSN